MIKEHIPYQAVGLDQLLCADRLTEDEVLSAQV